MKNKYGKYLGETILASCAGTPYTGFSPQDWAMLYIEKYGQIDGAHHKTWVLAQVARILKGTPIVLSLAEWENGHKEYRVNTGKPSIEYLEWVREMENDGEYDYDTGISP